MRFETLSPDRDIAAARHPRARGNRFFNPTGRQSGTPSPRARRPIQPPPGTRDWARPFSAGASSLMAHIVEGFALCATSLNPEGYWQWHEHANSHDPLIEPPRRRIPQARSRDPMARMAEADISGFLPLSGLVRTAADTIKPRKIDRATSGASDFSTFWRWVASIPRKLRSGFLRARARARTRAEWEAMDDRTLRDIGVSRRQVDPAARHPRWI